KAIESLFDELFDAFVVFDSNSDGKLHKTEFCEAIRNLNEPSLKDISDSVLEDLFDYIDSNADGIITLEEFLSTFTVDKRKGKAMRSNFKSLLQAFKRMDVDHDGRLSREEFRKGVENRLKLKLPSKILDEIIRRSDKQGTGFIDYEHFLE
ncbi:hypothetical protein GUITHDRAFT_58965, partial [Guillardia theta CCMP2712]